MLLTLLIVLLVLSLFGGGWGQARWGYASWSPAGILLVVLLVMLVVGPRPW